MVTPGSDKEGFWGTEGAGALLVARGTGRLFLVLRSSKVRNPGTWGLPGGALDVGESPRAGAARELMEETGYTGPLRLRPAHVFRAPNFTYHNFVGLVEGEFEPSLNWESDDAGWFDLEALPGPLHFGVSEMLGASRSIVQTLIEEAQDTASADEVIGSLAGSLALETHLRRLRSFSR